MTEETREIQYLRAARGAVSSGELKEAMMFYQMAYEESPENPEAKYFHNFTNFTDGYGENEDIRYPFLFVINSLEYAVKYVSKFLCSNYEKSLVITTITSTYNVLFDYLLNALDILGVDLIEEYIIGLYWLGSYIKEDFKENPEFMEFAIEPWEKAIELHQEYGCNHENYKAEEYAEKLKEIKPDYVMPVKPAENAREKRAREAAEQAEKKAREEAEKAERKAREEAEKAERKAREEAEKAERKAREEAEKAERIARQKAAEREKMEKEKKKFIIILAIIGAIVLIGAILPYFS